MRFARPAALGLMVLMLAMPSAWAAETPARSFGSYNCQQRFACSDTNQASSIATSCASDGFGMAADFSSASLNGSNCMNGKIGASGKGNTSAECCIVPTQDNNCAMRCTVFVQ